MPILSSTIYTRYVQLPCLSNRNDTLDLYRCDSNMMCNSLAKVDGSTSSIQVPVCKPTEFTAGRKISFAKIDVEGFEPQVIQGMDILPKAMVVEFYPKLLETAGNPPLDWINDLIDKGFEFSIITEEGLVETNPSKLTDIIKQDPEVVLNLLAKLHAH